ncbi:MAG: hypothetical protein JXR83_17250, partial [Deltaproteobacteria bacterium]|nr:hypothetical protein [Deltaproteobacteria bacterium]
MQRRKRSRLVAVAGLAAVVACQEDMCDPVFVELAPRIKLDVCLGGAGTSECAIDFGEVALSTRVSR